MQYDFQDFLCPDSLFFGDTSTTNTSLMLFLSHVLCLSFFFFLIKISILTDIQVLDQFIASFIPTHIMYGQMDAPLWSESFLYPSA